MNLPNVIERSLQVKLGSLFSQASPRAALFGRCIVVLHLNVVFGAIILMPRRNCSVFPRCGTA